MKALKIIGVAGVLMGLVSGSAIAAGEGFYVDLGVGTGKVNLPNIAGVNLDNKTTGYSFGAGYNINKFVAAEVGYQHMGDVAYSASGAVTGTYQGSPFTITASGQLAAENTKGWYFGPKFSLPINDQFELNARLGLFNWDTTVRLSGTAGVSYGGQTVVGAGSISKDYDGTDSYYGVGAAYNINKNIAVGIDYTQYKIDEYKVDTWGIKAKYSF
jgi:OOP family OmpA-OmpF porin